MRYACKTIKKVVLYARYKCAKSFFVLINYRKVLFCMKEMDLVLVFSGLVGAAIGVILTMILFKRLNKESKKRLRKEREEELIQLMKNFIETYNQFEQFLDKDISISEFIPLVHQKEITTEKYVYVPFGLNFKIPVSSLDFLIISFYYSGELIFALGENFNKKYEKEFEQIENYKEFSEKFIKVKKCFTKMEYKTEKIMAFERKDYLPLK